MCSLMILVDCCVQRDVVYHCLWVNNGNIVIAPDIRLVDLDGSCNCKIQYSTEDPPDIHHVGYPSCKWKCSNHLCGKFFNI